MAKGNKRQRDTIATVPLTPKVLRGRPTPIDEHGAALDLDAVDPDHGALPAVRPGNSRPLRLAPRAVDESSPGTASVSQPVASPRPRPSPTRFTGPLSVTHARPIWPLVVGAVAFAAAVALVLEMVL